METDIQLKINSLNLLYHRIINDTCEPHDKEIFKNLVAETKADGYRFRMGVPNVDFKGFDLSVYETRLFIRLELIRFLKIDATSEGLYWFSNYMRDAEKNLSRAIYVSLCKRSVLDILYFQLGNKKRIEFMQSGHAIDIYPLFNKTP